MPRRYLNPWEISYRRLQLDADAAHNPDVFVYGPNPSSGALGSAASVSHTGQVVAPQGANEFLPPITNIHYANRAVLQNGFAGGPQWVGPSILLAFATAAAWPSFQNPTLQALAKADGYTFVCCANLVDMVVGSGSTWVGGWYGTYTGFRFELYPTNPGVLFTVGTGAAREDTGEVSTLSDGLWTFTVTVPPGTKDHYIRLWKHGLHTGVAYSTVFTPTGTPAAPTDGTSINAGRWEATDKRNLGLYFKYWARALPYSELQEVVHAPFRGLYYEKRPNVAVVPPPSAPVNPAAAAGDGQVTVSWDAVVGATSYNLYWSTSSPVTTGDNKITGVTSPYVHTGRTNGTPYYYAVTAAGAGGESALSSEVSATPAAAAAAYTPPLVASDPETVGVWRIDRWQLGTPRATVALRDLKSVVKASLPLNVFTRSAYPKASSDIIGQPIPVGFGPLKGCKAYLIDEQEKRFKMFDCPVSTFDGVYTTDAEPITPDTLYPSLGEFVWSAYDGEDLLADATLPDDISIDIVKLLLTDDTRGVSVPLTSLDTTSTGKGFGSAGARTYHIRGTIPTRNNVEVPTYKIGLYVNTVKDVFQWIQDVLVAAFLTMYIDRTGVYQIKAWRPGRREDASEILEEQIIPGSVRPLVVASDAITRARVRYSINSGLDTAQVHEHSDDELRQLRGLPEHALLERELPLAEAFGAQQWAQRAVAMRGVPRRTLTLQTTQEHSQLEPGDYVGVTYSPLGIDSVWEVISATIKPGSSRVDLVLIDSRGFGDGAGWWTADAGTFNFPADLGGGAISAWSSGWTDAQKQWYRENWGEWTDPNGYADSANDPLWSFRGSRWV